MKTHGYLVLFRHREFRALWTSSALGVAATTMSSLSLGTLVFAQTGSPFLTAATMFGPSLVQLVGLGTLMSAADTARPRHALTAVSTATAFAFVLQAMLPLAPGARLIIVLGGAFMMSIGSGVRWGLMAEVLPHDLYAVGRSAMNVSVGVMQVLGFAVSGSLLHLLDVQQIFWVAAGLAGLAVPITWRGIRARPPRRSTQTGMRETWRGNRILLTLPSTRPLLLALTIPNGLVVGIEALFVPYAGDAAAMLFVASAAGMLAGDVVMGRALNEGQRRASAAWLRLWLALPFLIYIANPGVSLAALLAGSASIGYAASLAQQELLVKLTPRHLSGQVLGAESAARVACQGLGALLAGGLAEATNPGQAIGLLALGSLLVSVSLSRSLARAARHAATSRAPSPYLTIAGASPAQPTHPS